MEFGDPALTFALALAAGIIAQSTARHLQVPGIILLLLVGALLGPAGANVIRPDSLGGALDILVGLSVAVILFEGGLSLSLTRLRREARVIRLLITVGAVVTGACAAVAAHLVMGWSWPIAVTFGAVVIVTGPTVITPLLRRVRVRRNVGTILEAEGVMIDPIGAILAVVALELVLTETAGETARGLIGIPSRLLLGAVVGLLGGLLIALVLRFRKLVPEGLESMFTLSLVLVLYEISDTIQHETGVMAAAVAGLVVGNVGPAVPRELREFKEQLTVLLVGLLFVLLAADVRLESVTALGWRGMAVVTLLMLVIRPLAVAISTWGSGLTWRERAFIAWLGPRGIVAAAVASVFAERFLSAGYPIGEEFQALVFLVIAVTVVVQGFTSGPVAAALGVRRPKDQGHVIVGANALGRAVAGALKEVGEDVVLIDTNATEARTAQDAGFRVVYGNANDERVLIRADLAGRRSFTAVTTNESANVLLARGAKEDYRVSEAFAALDSEGELVSPDRARVSTVQTLFGEPLDVDDWIHALRNGEARVQRWRLESAAEPDPPAASDGAQDGDAAVPLVRIRSDSATPVGSATRFRPGDVVAFGMRTRDPAPPTRPPGRWVPA